jgi:predicted transcriptional regulator of viral defense system
MARVRQGHAADRHRALLTRFSHMAIPYYIGTVLRLSHINTAVAYQYGTLLRMTIMDRVLEIAGYQHGYITARQATDAGIPPVELRKLAQRGRLDHPAHGVYRVTAFPRRTNDELMEATLWPDGRGVISHESALALWDLADVNPRRIHVTVPSPYRPRKQGGSLYRVWPRDLDANEVDEVDGIPTVTPERAILDAARHGLQQRFVEQAILTARNRQLFGRETEMRIRQRLRDLGNSHDDTT